MDVDDGGSPAGLPVQQPNSTQPAGAAADCAICLRPLPTGSDTLRCGHSFHLQCLAAWTLSASYANDAHSMCPSCRTDIIDAAATRANQFCGRCSISLAESTNELLYGPSPSNIWCPACTQAAFVEGIRARLVIIYAGACGPQPRMIPAVQQRIHVVNWLVAAVLVVRARCTADATAPLRPQPSQAGRHPRAAARVGGGRGRAAGERRGQVPPRHNGHDRASRLAEIYLHLRFAMLIILVLLMPPSRYELVGRIHELRAEIFQIYTHSNPRKLADIDQLLLEWKGEEEHLLANIIFKFQVWPTTSLSRGLARGPCSLLELDRPK
jgi:hypothetical protein